MQLGMCGDSVGAELSQEREHPQQPTMLKEAVLSQQTRRRRQKEGQK